MLPEDAWAQLWATLQRVLQVRPPSRIPLGPKVLAKKTLAHKGQRSAELGISKPSIWHSFKIAFSGASLERDPVEGKVNCKGSFSTLGKRERKPLACLSNQRILDPINKGGRDLQQQRQRGGNGLGRCSSHRKGPTAYSQARVAALSRLPFEANSKIVFYTRMESSFKNPQLKL